MENSTEPADCSLVGSPQDGEEVARPEKTVYEAKQQQNHPIRFQYSYCSHLLCRKKAVVVLEHCSIPEEHVAERLELSRVSAIWHVGFETKPAMKTNIKFTTIHTTHPKDTFEFILTYQREMSRIV